MHCAIIVTHIPESPISNGARSHPMKKYIVLITTVIETVIVTPALANADLAKQRGCLSCHAVDRKLVGPSFQAVAQKYAGSPAMEEILAERVKGGTKGTWGPVPMPPNNRVSISDIKTIVTWILAGAPVTATATTESRAVTSATENAESKPAQSTSENATDTVTSAGKRSRSIQTGSCTPHYKYYQDQCLNCAIEAYEIKEIEASLEQWFIFQDPPGTKLQGGVPIPKLSLPHPIRNSDVDRLNEQDWVLIKETLKKASAAADSERPPCKEYRGQIRMEYCMRAQKLSDKAADEVIDCYLKQASTRKVPDSVIPKPSSQIGKTSLSDSVQPNEVTKAEKQAWQTKMQENGWSPASGKKNASSTAPLIDGKCVKHTQYGSGVSDNVKRVFNGCGRPVQVLGCYYKPGNAAGCRNGNQGWGVSSTIPPNGSTIGVSHFDGPWRVVFYVCDMSDASKVCVLPKQIHVPEGN